MDFNNYLNTKKGLTQNTEYGKTGLKLSGALLLSLAAVQTDAQVMITNVPAANQLVTNGVFPVNVDGAGGAELNISVVAASYYSSRRIYLNGLTAQFQVQRDGTSVYYGYPYKLNAGALVNAGGGMQAPAANNSLTYGATFGNWNNDATVGYIGFRFNIGANVHYGWLELSVVDGNPGPNSATITRFAYEATPNKTIVAGASASLPVSLISFSVNPFEGTNNLSWETAQEVNSKGFEVQRSTNGKQFEKIGFVESLGNSNQKQKYYFTDNDLAPVEYYYRLKQVDIDNTFSYSEIIKVQAASTTQNEIVLYANPVRNGRLDFSYHAVSKGALSINIFDLNGKVVHTETAIANEGATQLRVDMSHLPAGVYYLKCEQNNTMHYKKVVVQ